METVFDLVVADKDRGQRIDKFISCNLNNISRSYAQDLIKENRVLFNEEIIKDKNYRVDAGQHIKVSIPEPKELEVKPENIKIDIVYEDKDMLVVNKPKGMVVHPAPGNYSSTLVNALLYYCKEELSSINGVIRPGIVHRIDKDTSGLLMVAKNDFSHRELAKQIKDHSFSREYEAIVYGIINQDKGVIDAPIGRHKIYRKKMAVTKENSREAYTEYRVIKRYNNFTHVRLILKTGRTHQIRVHMAYIGHPVAGDEVYGPKKVIKELSGQCLHAKYIGFIHPRTKKRIEIESELPEYFKDFLKKIGS